MAGHQTVAEQVDAKVFGLVLEQYVDPFLSMVVVLARQWIVPKQKAAPHDAADDMHDARFVGGNDFTTVGSSHDRVSEREQSVPTLEPQVDHGPECESAEEIPTLVDGAEPHFLTRILQFCLK